MVWKLVAAIEDGVDNGWLLIRADAGSLSNSFSDSFLCVLRMPCSVQKVKSCEGAVYCLRTRG